MLGKIKEKRELEEKLPDALFQASSLTSITSFEEVIEKLSHGNNALSRKFREMHRQIKHGIPTKEVLEETETDSDTFKRTLNLLSHGYRTGKIENALRETAEDINQTQSIIRERKTNTLIEKYTLLIAGGCLVPLILGTLVSMVSEIGVIELSGMTTSTRQAIITNASNGSLIYIAEYALLASIFAGIQESRKEKAVIYALVLVPSSLIIYHIAKNGIAF